MTTPRILLPPTKKRTQDMPHSFEISPPCIWRMGYGTSRPAGPFPGNIAPTITASKWQENNFLIEET